jgi:hypothetical protein
MDIHQLINSDVDDSRPSRELAETLLQEDMSEMSEDMEDLVEEEEEEEGGEQEREQEEEEEESATQRTSTRGSQWKTWEDRALVKEVLAVDPFNCERGTTEKKWREVSASMERVGSHRSEHSCKGRIDKLRREHEVDTTFTVN